MAKRVLMLAMLALAALAMTTESALGATAPKPISLSGSGARVLSIRLARNQPVVVTATHTGAANFVLKLVGQGANELLVNEIGHYRGQVAYADAHAGRYHLQVEADGHWTIRITQPVRRAATRACRGPCGARVPALSQSARRTSPSRSLLRRTVGKTTSS